MDTLLRGLRYSHQGQQGGLLPVHRDHNTGHLGQPRQLGGPQPPLSGYQLIAAAGAAHR